MQHASGQVPILFMGVIKMKNLGYYNGKYDEIENMQIPMLDRVCWFGDGVYDATYAHNHIVFDMEVQLKLLEVIFVLVTSLISIP